MEDLSTQCTIIYRVFRTNMIFNNSGCKKRLSLALIQHTTLFIGTLANFSFFTDCVLHYIFIFPASLDNRNKLGCTSLQQDAAHLVSANNNIILSLTNAKGRSNSASVSDTPFAQLPLDLQPCLEQIQRKGYWNGTAV